MNNQDIPCMRLKDIVVFLEKKLGRTSVLVQRLEKPLLKSKAVKAGTEQKTRVDNNTYVSVKSAETPVLMFESGTEGDLLDTDIHPPLPELGSTEPLESIIANLTINSRARTLTLPNGVRLTFNQVLALAGNFYGLLGDSICVPNVTSHTPARQFMLAFNNLAYKDPDVLQSQLDQLLAIMRIEKNSVDTVLGQGDPAIPTVLDESVTYTEPSEMYKRHGLWFTKQYDSILGGRWERGAPSKYGKVLNLAKKNLDNYQPYCLEVWRTGHNLALAKAREAGQVYREDGRAQQGYALLEEAYGISAFSCHFLVQSFTAGHIRVPVKKLISDVGSSANGYKLGYYHFLEDEMYGINVINKLNERWTCWGQTTFYDRANQGHRKRVVRAVQDSVLQIFAAFTDANYEGDYSVVLNQVPEPDTRLPNNNPLFKVAEDGRILRRYDVKDLSCSATIDNWWGGTTLNTGVKSTDRRNSAIH